MSNDAVTRSASMAWVREHMSEALQHMQMISDANESEEVDRAIELARTVTDHVESAQLDSLEAKAGPTCFNILGNMLRLRYNAVRDLESLHESIRWSHRAVEGLTDEDDDERTCNYLNLTTGLVLRYEDTSNERYLTEAIEIAHVLGHDKVPGTIDSMLSLHMAMELHIVGFDKTDNPSHLDGAIEAIQPILEHGESLGILYLDILNRTESLYGVKFRLTGDSKYLDRVVLLSQETIDTVESIPTVQRDPRCEIIRLDSLRSLAHGLLERYQVSGRTEDVRAAFESQGKLVAEDFNKDQEEPRIILWVDLMEIYETVFTREGHFGPLVHESILETVRILTDSDAPPYKFLLGCGEEKRPRGEPEADKERNTAAVAWLSGIAGLFEESWRKTGSDDDIELAVVFTFNAMSMASFHHISWGELITSQRARWRMWSEHVGKIPDSEVMFLSVGGFNWIPEGMIGGLGIELGPVVNFGRLEKTDELGDTEPCTAHSLANVPEDA